MQIPKRKAGKFANIPTDYNITKKKFDILKTRLKSLKNKQPEAIKDVERLALMGDFSENAAYQIAKGRLRSINYRIDEIEDFLKHAKIITPSSSTDIVQLGSIVTIENAKKQFVFQILGSSETDPAKGVISQNSPLGKALMGRRIREQIEIIQNNKTIKYEIVKIK